MDIIFNGSKIGEAEYEMRSGDILILDGVTYKVSALDLYDEPMALVALPPPNEKCTICGHPIHRDRCECIAEDAPSGCVCEFVGWQIKTGS